MTHRYKQEEAGPGYVTMQNAQVGSKRASPSKDASGRDTQTAPFPCFHTTPYQYNIPLFLPHLTKSGSNRVMSS